MTAAEKPGPETETPEFTEDLPEVTAETVVDPATGPVTGSDEAAGIPPQDQPEPGGFATDSQPDPLPDSPPAPDHSRADIVDEALRPGPAPARASARKGGGGSAVLGGAVAAVLGFGISHFNLFNLRADVDAQAIQSRLAQVEADLAASTKAGQEALTTFENSAGEARAAASAQAEQLSARFDQLSGLLDSTGTRLDALDQALASAAAASAGGEGINGAAFAALKAEVDALKAAPAAQPDLAALKAEIQSELAATQSATLEQAEAEAATVRAEARQDAALALLGQALTTGAPYADTLQALDATQLPPALVEHAQTGLPTLAALTDSFPDAARESLAIALRAGSGNETMGDRAWTFLKLQTGVRSLSPQEGDGPDAVLSRAEAAVRGGDLTAALAAIQNLPVAAQAPFAEWRSKAEARIAAEAALATLTTR